VLTGGRSIYQADHAARERQAERIEQVQQLREERDEVTRRRHELGADLPTNVRLAAQANPVRVERVRARDDGDGPKIADHWRDILKGPGARRRKG
jgi:hypothetical protein